MEGKPWPISKTKTGDCNSIAQNNTAGELPHYKYDGDDCSRGKHRFGLMVVHIGNCARDSWSPWTMSFGPQLKKKKRLLLSTVFILLLFYDSNKI